MSKSWRSPALVLGLTVGLGLIVCLASLSGREAADVHGSTLSAPPRPTELAAVAVLPAQREAAPAVRENAWFAAVPGDQLTFDVDWTSRLELRAEPSSEMPSVVTWSADEPFDTEVALTSRLRLTVLEMRNGPSWRLLAELSDVHGSVVGSQSEQQLEPACLAPGVQYWFSADGRVVDVAFPAETSSMARGMWRALLTQFFQFVPRRESTRWIVDELEDETGTYQAEFGWRTPVAARADHCLERRKSRYVTARGAGMPFEIESSLSEAEFADSWIHSAHVDERSTSKTADLRATYSIRGSLKLLERSHAPAVEDRTRDAAFEWSALADASEPRFDLGDLVDDTRAEELPELLSALADLERGGEITSLDAFRLQLRLCRLLAQHPQVLREIEASLLNGSLVALQGIVTNSIGIAGGQGCSEAVAVLSRLIASDAASAELRLSALFAGHELGSHAGQLLPVLPSIMNDGAHPELQSAAVLLAGALAGKSADDRAAAELLQAVATWSVEHDRRDLYLDAIANTRDRTLITESALESIHDASAAVRTSASDALRWVDDPEVSRLLGAIAADAGEDSVVRLAALRALGEHSNHPEAIEPLLRMTGDSNVEIRMAALGSLGRHMEDQESRLAIAFAAANDADANVRRWAAELMKTSLP